MKQKPEKKLSHNLIFDNNTSIIAIYAICCFAAEFLPKNPFLHSIVTAQKMKFSIKDFFSKCDQIRSFLRIWSHLLKKL